MITCPDSGIPSGMINLVCPLSLPQPTCSRRQRYQIGHLKPYPGVSTAFIFRFVKGHKF